MCTLRVCVQTRKIMVVLEENEKIIQKKRNVRQKMRNIFMRRVGVRFVVYLFWFYISK